MSTFSVVADSKRIVKLASKYREAKKSGDASDIEQTKSELSEAIKSALQSSEKRTASLSSKPSTELPGGKRRNPRKTKRAKKQSKKTASRRR